MKIGLALGGGAARGWAHIGVIETLRQAGIEPEIICGTSVGAIVGAAEVCGQLTNFHARLLRLTKLEVASFVRIQNGWTSLIHTEKLRNFLQQYAIGAAPPIEQLQRRFATVATQLDTGRETWITQGGVLEAVWPSIALPGIFPPVYQAPHWLVDGGLCNPVPVSVCRALGADVVIAVHLNRMVHQQRLAHVQSPKAYQNSKVQGILDAMTPSWWQRDPSKEAHPPSLLDAITASINITQDRIMRSRLAGDPAEFLIEPDLSAIGLLDFHRAEQAIACGAHATHLRLSDILSSLNR